MTGLSPTRPPRTALLIALLFGSAGCVTDDDGSSESDSASDGDGDILDPTTGGNGSAENQDPFSAGGVGPGGGSGAAATGGAPDSGGGGSESGGSNGGGTTISVPLIDYVSRKWARWPMPNPPSLGLPHPMSYSVAAEGVLDNVTGLVWQETTNSSTTTWLGALAYCESLGPGWTLPTRIELTTILNNAVSGPKINSAIFSFGGGAGWTWASTPWVVNERSNLMGDAALSWFINFAVGDSNNSLSQTAASAYSRCVRVPESQTLPALHYVVSPDEVVDQYTGLVWQRGHSGAEPSLSFDEAFTYCEGLDITGNEWRLPSLNELGSLVDDVPSGDVSPATDHEAFPETAPDAQYWSQSPYGSNSNEHWTLNFEDGFTAHRSNETSGIARCVR